MSNTYSLPLGSADNDKNTKPTSGQPISGSASAPKGGEEEIKWVVVERTSGLLPARIMVDRLQIEGVPARAWQEGAGQALGLVVGILGTGYVMVPEERQEEARTILDAYANEPIEWEETDDESNV